MIDRSPSVAGLAGAELLKQLKQANRELVRAMQAKTRASQSLVKATRRVDAAQRQVALLINAVQPPLDWTREEKPSEHDPKAADPAQGTLDQLP